MHRRDMLKAGLAAGADRPRAAPGVGRSDFSPVPKGWRTFALTTRVEPTFASKAWIPLPTFTADDWQRPGATTWTGNARVAEKVRDPKYGAEMLRVEWAADQQNPADRGHHPGRRRRTAPSASARARSRRSATRSAGSTLWPPTCCRSTASSRRRPRASCGARPTTSTRRARIYEWVVDNTFRNAKTARLRHRRRRVRCSRPATSAANAPT